VLGNVFKSAAQSLTRLGRGAESGVAASLEGGDAVAGNWVLDECFSAYGDEVPRGEGPLARFVMSSEGRVWMKRGSSQARVSKIHSDSAYQTSHISTVTACETHPLTIPSMLDASTLASTRYTKTYQQRRTRHEHCYRNRTHISNQM